MYMTEPDAAIADFEEAYENAYGDVFFHCEDGDQEEALSSLFEAVGRVVDGEASDLVEALMDIEVAYLDCVDQDLIDEGADEED